MNELYKPLLNWRIHVLAILAMIALILLAGDSEDITTFFVTKVIGFGICYITYRLAKYWHSRGLIDEIEE